MQSNLWSPPSSLGGLASSVKGPLATVGVFMLKIADLLRRCSLWFKVSHSSRNLNGLFLSLIFQPCFLRHFCGIVAKKSGAAKKAAKVESGIKRKIPKHDVG